MASSKKSTVVKQQPLAGAFDARSEPEEIPKDGWRMLQNIGVFGIGGRLCRAPGWSKLFSSDDYNNADLHDQLLTLQIYYDTISEVADETVLVYPPNNPDFADFCGETAHTRTQGRQPITFLTQVESTAATRRLLAGTQSRLYALNQRGGNWRIIGDGFGGTEDNPEIRWRHTRVGDYVLLTNDYDAVHYWPYDAPPSGCAMQAVKPVPELETIGVTKAKVILEFRGIVILANIEEDGTRKTNMVRWSGLAAPLEWIEDPGVSTAGHQELDYGEEVLAGGTIGNFAFLYTNRGIWQVAVSTDPAIVFDFRKVYSSDQGESCIRYPHTFMSIGDAHFYMANDAIYAWSQYSPRPERVEWIHRASQILYDGINDSNCAVHTAGFDPLTKQLYFSCALGTETLPSVTLVCNVQYRQAYKLDHGFSAFAAYVPDDRPSIRDFMVENCLLPVDCFTSEEALELGSVDLKAGALAAVNEACYETAESVCHRVYLYDDLLEGEEYDGSSMATAPLLDTQKQYVVIPGENEIVCYNGDLLNPYREDYTQTTIFTPVDGEVILLGNCYDCPVTASLHEFTGYAEVFHGELIESTEQPCEEDSMCGLAGDMFLNDLCRKCDGASRSIGASAGDWCLKQFGEVYHRERHTGDGVYVLDGYQTRLLKCLRGNSEMMALTRLLLQFRAELDSTPLQMNLRIGGSTRAEDPLQSCGIEWSDEGARDVDCADNDKPMEWLLWAAASFLYIDLTIDGVGGASCYSSMELEVQPVC